MGAITVNLSEIEGGPVANWYPLSASEAGGKGDGSHGEIFLKISLIENNSGNSTKNAK